MSNSNVCDVLERAKLVFVERPAAARKSNTSATASLLSGLRCKSQILMESMQPPTCPSQCAAKA